MAAMMAVDFQNCFIFIILCLFSILCYFLFFRKQKNSRLGFELPPSPPSLPIIGHLHHIISPLFHKSLQKLSSKYGLLLHLRIFNVPVLVVSSASIAYEVYKAQDVNISSRGQPMMEGSLIFGFSGFLISPYGDYWKFMKKLIVTQFLGPQALERLRGIRADEVVKFYSNLLDKAMNEESVDIRVEAMKLINNSTCKMLMGRICSEDAERVRILVSETDGLTKKVLLVSILHKWLDKFRISLFKKEIMGVSCRYDKLLARILVEHEAKLQDHQNMDLMDVLLEAHGDENAEYKITRNHIKSLLVDLLLASSDTSTHTIEWTMAEMINNPKTLERLRGEIDSLVGKTRLIQETDLPNLPYLQAVIKEGLRLHPSVPVLIRNVQYRCKINGYDIAEKTTLLVNAYAIMRDADLWDDPEEFKPERFLGQKDNLREEVLNYLPFGSGRRACPGTNLAYLFMGTAIGVMVQCFDWRIKGEKVNMDETGGTTTLIMANPLHCTLVARTIISPTPTS